MEVTKYDRHRFGIKVQVDLKTGCHEWVAVKTSGGYGQFSWGGKRRLAHRVAYEWVHGPIPDGLLVCHHCDNRKCVNVDHMFLGTHKDNMQDAVSKGRLRVGRRGGRSRGPDGEVNVGCGRTPFFSDKQRLVVAAYEAGESVSVICRHVGLTRQGVLGIIKKYSKTRTCGRQPKSNHRVFFPEA